MELMIYGPWEREGVKVELENLIQYTPQKVICRSKVADLAH